MESLAVVPALANEPVELLIADDDAALRSLIAVRARAALAAVAVLEAADGAEAVQLCLQRRPQIALLDVNMPRLDGIEVALVLRELLPGLRLALHTGDPAAHTEAARELCLPLFDKLELDHALRWLERQARSSAAGAPRKLTLECVWCGYRIERAAPPERCPMCHAEDAFAPQYTVTRVPIDMKL